MIAAAADPGAAERARLGTILFLVSEAMLFAALLSAWLVLAGRAAPWAIELRPVVVATAALLLSSFTVARAVRERRAGRSGRAWRAATLALGALFLALQAREYAELVGRGLTWSRDVYGSAFYVLTGVHGLHVLGGLAALALLGASARTARFDLAALYWHFVDGVWLVLFAVLYLGA